MDKYYTQDAILLDKLIHEIEPSTPDHALLLLYSLFIDDQDPVMSEGYIKELKEGLYDIPKKEAIEICRFTMHYKEAFLLADAWGMTKIAWDILFRDQNDIPKSLDYLAAKIEMNSKDLILILEQICKENHMILLQDPYTQTTMNLLCNLGSTPSYVISTFLMNHPMLLSQYLSCCPFSEFSLYMILISYLKSGHTSQVIDIIKQSFPLSDESKKIIFSILCKYTFHQGIIWFLEYNEDYEALAQYHMKQNNPDSLVSIRQKICDNEILTMNIVQYLCGNESIDCALRFIMQDPPLKMHNLDIFYLLKRSKATTDQVTSFLVWSLSEFSKNII